MLKLLTCPRGHRWGYMGSAHSSTSGGVPLCPVCGDPANPAPPDASTRIIQQAAAPTLQNLGKAAKPGSSSSDAAPPFDERVTLVLPSAVPPNMDEQPTLALQDDATVEEQDRIAEPLGPPQVADYEILRELGRGGMGVVYQARQKSLQRLVALKMILAGSHARAEDRERFQIEAQAIARLQHPNIVRIHEVGEAEGRPFLSLEYVDGGSLAHRLNGTPLPPRQAGRLVAVMARAVEAAHQQGLVHRDLKPSNILLQRKAEIRNLKSEISNPKSEGDRAGAVSDFGFRISDFDPKITDFGLAKELENGSAQSRTGAIVGTPCYMAPEQTTGRGASIQPATDVYALGAILYELLTGRPPFQGETPLDTLQQVQANDPVPPRRFQPKVPIDLETICLKCLQKEPSHRYVQAAALADDLHRFLAGHPIAARPVRWWERLSKWGRRKPTTVALLAVTATALLLLLVGGVWHTVSLQHALTSADELRVAAQAERDQTLAQQRLVREYVYGADIKLAQALWDNAEVRQSIELLEKYRPAPGADDLREFTWHYLWRLCHGDRRTLSGHTKDVYYVAYSPDGKLLASAGEDGTVHLRDAATGEPRTVIAAHGNEVSWAAFSPDGRLLATASDDGSVKLWDVEAGTESARLEVSAKPVVSAVFAPDGGLLATAGEDAYVRLWDPSNRTMLAALKVHTGIVEALAFSPDGRTLVSCGQDGLAILWDVAQRRERVRLSDGPAVLCKHVAYSPDGKMIGLALADGTVKLWDAATAKLLRVCRGHTDYVQAVAFSPDSRTVATGSNDETVRLWDAATGKALHLLRGHTRRVWSVAFAPDGQTLASGSRDRTVRLWNPRPSEVWHPLCLEGSPVTTLTQADPGTLLLARQDGSIQRWDLELHRLQSTLLSALEGGAGSPMPISRNGKAIARQLRDRVQLWDVEANRLRLEAPGARPGTPSALSPNGQLLALQSADLTIHVWDAATGQPRFSARDPRSEMLCAAFSPDGRTLATGHNDHSIALWDTRDGTSRGVLFGHKGEVSCLAFAPDGCTLASGSMDHSAKLWDTATGEERGSLLGHSAALTAIAFTPDGRTLATGSDDHGIRLWSVRTGLQLAHLDGHSGAVRAVVFANGGETLVSGGADPAGWGQVLLWQSSPRPSR